MPRFNRSTVAEFPHHVTQRGNRCSLIFLDDQDRRIFLRKLKETFDKYELQILSYCLMDNHFHLIPVPKEASSLSLAMRDLLGPYATYFNQKHGITGRLWQGRFYSCVLDDPHLWEALRYVELNPVRAGLVRKAEDYPWSSAQSHCGLKQDDLLAPIHVPGNLITDWSLWLADEHENTGQEFKRIRQHTKTGRPCGADAFIDELERILGRPLKPQKGGRPRTKNLVNG